MAEPGNTDQPDMKSKLVTEREVQILDAAARLFSEKGFHRTTTRDIAREADVSEGTLYNYFDSKNDMLMGIMTRLNEAQQLNYQLEKSFPDDATQTLHALLENRQNFIGQNRNMIQAVLSEILVDPDLRKRYYDELMEPLLSRLEEHIQRRIDLGEKLTGEPAIMARLLVGLLNGLFILSVIGDPVTIERWNVLDDSILEIFLNGIKG